MKIDYRVKELTFEDLVLYNETFYLTLSNLRESPTLEIERSKNILERINSQDSYVFVAINENYGIIGTSKLMVEQKFLRGGLKAGHIEDVATRKGFGNMGVATDVVRRAIDFAREQQCYKIVLDREKRLKDFYARFGFEDEGDFMRLYL